MIIIGTFALGIILFCLLAIIHFWTKNREANARLARLQAIQQIRHHTQTDGLERNLEQVLEFVSTLVDAPTFAFYIYDEKNENYVLRAVRQATGEFGSIKPSYSGLAQYQRETYLPPLSLTKDSVQAFPCAITDGDVPLFVLPFPAHSGVIRLGPIREELEPKRIQMLMEVCRDLSPVLHEIVQTDRLKRQVNMVVASGQALQNISGAATNPQITADIILRASVLHAGARGGMLLACSSLPKIRAVCNMSHTILRDLEQDAHALSSLVSISRANSAVVLRQGQQEFYQIPKQVAALGGETIVLCRVAESWLFIMWGETTVPAFKAESFEQIRDLANQLNSLELHQIEVSRAASAYTEILKHLAVTADYFNAHTVGYSELMARYSIVIAKQLGLPDDEIHNIALAAFLSNIGILGLSTELFRKEGQYSEAEYEMMKLHAEVGAAIIEITTGNHQAASFVRYHHERYDGNGYPEGRAGNEIPLGARILAVVQVFLAKINRRGLRDPLPFEKALELLKSASDSQLDGHVVDAFLSWIATRSHFFQAE